MADYDVSQAFKRIENKLIDSMMRNLERHRAEELEEGFNWEQWQAIQLKEMERFRIENPKRFGGDFSEINKRAGDAITTTYGTAETKEERKLLEQIKKGKLKPPTGEMDEARLSFFGINEGRINALMDATKADFVRGEQAMLRTANDEYRKVIFNAQMYSASGAATYEQAVDMATKDFLQKGINCIVYKNGARHTMQDYSRMALKTAQKRAYLMGEGNARDKYGIHTVRVNSRTNACPLCVKWLNRVLIDDVYASGTEQEAREAHVPLLSEAMDEGFLHPNCKDVYSTYIEGISEPAKPWSKKEIQEITEKYNEEQKIQHAEDMAESYNRMAKYSLDPANQARYQARADEWSARADALMPNNITAGFAESVTWNGMSGTAETKPLSGVQKTGTSAKPLIPEETTFTATTSSGKNVAMKPLKAPISGGKLPFDKKLNPKYEDYIEHLKVMYKAKADDAVMKPLYEEAISKATEKIAKLKATNGTKSQIATVYQNRKKWENRVKIIDMKAEVKDLEKILADAKTAKATQMPADKVYSGIWKQDVKLSEFKTYESKIQAKLDYFEAKEQEWFTKGLSYGKTQAEVDAKVKEMNDLWLKTAQYKQEGEKYQKAVDALDSAIKQAEDAVEAKKDEILKLENPKKWAKQHGAGQNAIDQKRRDAGIWAKTPKEADNALRQRTGNVWRNATELEKDAIYEYTVSFHKFNEPLRGIEYGTNRFLGVGKTDLNAGYANNGPYLNAMTDMIEKSVSDVDMWFQRGVGYKGMDKFFGVSETFLRTASQQELEQKLLGEVKTEYGFMSMGSSKGKGFSGGIIMNIFTPKGTKMMYVEPFSGFGHGAGRGWDGVSKQSTFGHELETILQQGANLKITKVERSGGTLYVDFDVVGNAPQQRWEP